MHHFADDTKVLYTSKSLKDINEKIKKKNRSQKNNFFRIDF